MVEEKGFGYNLNFHMIEGVKARHGRTLKSWYLPSPSEVEHC